MLAKIKKTKTKLVLLFIPTYSKCSIDILLTIHNKLKMRRKTTIFDITSISNQYHLPAAGSSQGDFIFSLAAAESAFEIAFARRQEMLIQLEWTAVN